MNYDVSIEKLNCNRREMMKWNEMKIVAQAAQNPIINIMNKTKNNRNNFFDLHLGFRLLKTICIVFHSPVKIQRRHKKNTQITKKLPAKWKKRFVTEKRTIEPELWQLSFNVAYEHRRAQTIFVVVVVV